MVNQRLPMLLIGAGIAAVIFGAVLVAMRNRREGPWMAIPDVGQKIYVTMSLDRNVKDWILPVRINNVIPGENGQVKAFEAAGDDQHGRHWYFIIEGRRELPTHPTP